MEPDNFINALWPIIEKVGNELDMSDVIKQICLAQGALETGYGSSALMVKAHALFGIKATKSWHGKVYSAKTNEVYAGIEQTISATFRAYDTVADSVRDYFKLLQGKRYKDALTAETVEDAIHIIVKGGYATDPRYAEKVINIYKQVLLGAIPVVKSNVEQVKPASDDIDKLAHDVLKGKYGNGEQRKRLLGTNYAAVQHRVNILLRGGK